MLICWWIMQRKTAAQRGYGHKWRKESKAYLAKHPWCSLHGGGCTLIATLVDHVVPHRGDMRLFWNRDNWQGLCEHCHNVHKARLESAMPERDRRGRLIFFSTPR